MLSIIIPVLNESAVIGGALTALAPLRARGSEVVVVDGGGCEVTRAITAEHRVRLLKSARGRARQMNAGVAGTTGEILLFLHADTTLPIDADLKILESFAHGARWGRFDVDIDAANRIYRLVERSMNLRSRLTGIATGDQGLFVDRALFESVGGFPTIELMEDVALSARLRRVGSPACLPERVTTSARRWQRDGAVVTVLRMWLLRVAYAFGSNPSAIARWYR